MSTEMIVTLPGGKKVDTRIGNHVIRTDQPVSSGGEDTAPAPFDLFLASVGTCAGIYVAGFCQKRGLPTEGIRLLQRNHVDPETAALAPGEVLRRARPGRRSVQGEEDDRGPAGLRGEGRGGRRPASLSPARGRPPRCSWSGPSVTPAGGTRSP